MNNFKQLLIEARTHRDFLKWMEDRTSEQAWKDCERGDWLSSILVTLEYPLPTLVEVGVKFVESLLPLYEAKNPKDTRIRECIKGCKRFSNREIDKEKLNELRFMVIKAKNEAYEKTYGSGLVIDSAFYVAHGTFYAANGNPDFAAYEAALAYTTEVIGSIERQYTIEDINRVLAHKANFKPYEGNFLDCIIAHKAKFEQCKRDKLKEYADIVREIFPNYPGLFKKEKVAVSN